jgi:vanillate/3-O-methylgallate O-demethylase
MRLGNEEFLYEGGPFAFWSAHKLQTGQYKATAELIGGYNFQVSGPNSLYLLEKAGGESLRDIKFMHFRRINISGREVSALRQGMAGELSYELQGPLQDAVDAYNTILEVGKEFGIRRLGDRAFAVNYLEACLPTSTVDYLPAILGEKQAG